MGTYDRFDGYPMHDPSLDDHGGGTAHHQVEHKWSAWSADRELWKEYGGAGFLRDLDTLGVEGDTLIVDTTSRKEPRTGAVTITRDENADGTPGAYVAEGYFVDCWDEWDALADTLGVTVEDLEPQDIACMECDGPGIAHHFKVRADSADGILEAVDREEDKLLEKSATDWQSLVEWAEGRKSDDDATDAEGE